MCWAEETQACAGAAASPPSRQLCGRPAQATYAGANQLAEMRSAPCVLRCLRDIPYSENGDDSLVIQHVKGGGRPKISEASAGMPPAYQALMVQCWAQEAQDRPGFTYIVQALREMLGPVVP